MAVLKTNIDVDSNLEDAIEMQQKEDLLMWKDDSMKGIVKAITWPTFKKAIKYTAYSMLASVVIGTVLYFYSYGISQIISLF